MIVVKLMGGLGNQMFQYAAGRRLAHMHDVGLKLDTSWFDTQDLRTVSLGALNIKENFATLEEITALTVRRQGIVERVLNRILRRLPKPAPTYVQEKHFHFDPDILSLPDGVYLDGYWQSEKYFADSEEIIRKEFTVKTSQVGKDKELAEQIASCESVSLHIRRGDYVSDPRTNQEHGACDMDYYFRSVEHITQVVIQPHFFIFSDEPEWARDNLKLSYPTTFVSHNRADKSYEDLRLMSQCKHHIIANSSFSWWGAWLNPRNDKMVFAPKQWFGKKNQDSHNMADLLPQTWNIL